MRDLNPKYENIENRAITVNIIAPAASQRFSVRQFYGNILNRLAVVRGNPIIDAYTTDELQALNV